MSTEQRDDYEWRHNWVPLTLRAALQKTRGDHEAAERLLGERRRRRAARGPVEFSSPNPRHQLAAAERATWAGKTDDDLADELGAADDATVERIVAELDRRDARARKTELQRARRAAAYRARDARREAEFDEHLAAGLDPQQAYARAWGIEEERVRRDEAIGSLRSSGYKGKGFTELCRAAFSDHAEQSFMEAEAECRGVLLTKQGLLLEERGKLSPRSLFRGPESRARKYASRELLDYWQANGRPTVDDFTAAILGGHMRSASTAAWS